MTQEEFVQMMHALMHDDAFYNAFEEWVKNAAYQTYVERLAPLEVGEFTPSDFAALFMEKLQGEMATPQDLVRLFTRMTDTWMNKLQENIDAEAQAREEADIDLQANIDAEATARADADAALNAGLNNHTADNVRHITATERTSWNNMLATPSDNYNYLLRNSQKIKHGGSHAIDLTDTSVWDTNTAYWLVVWGAPYQDFVVYKHTHDGGMWTGSLLLRVFHRGYGWGSGSEIMEAQWAQGFGIYGSQPILHGISTVGNDNIALVGLRGGNLYRLAGNRYEDFSISPNPVTITEFEVAPEPFVAADTYGKVFDADFDSKVWKSSYDITQVP